MKFIIVALLSAVSWSLYAIEDADRQQIQQRIQAVGKVHVQGINDTSLAEIKTKTTATIKKDPGQDTYEHFCIVCHRDGLAGAPKFQDANDWKLRMSGKKIEDLIGVSIKGLNAMPPKGTCSECSDDDLKAAIQYMLPKS